MSGLLGHRGLLLGAGGAPSDGSVVLLLHGDGIDGSTTFVDSSPYARSTYDVSGASLSTTTSVFGVSSMYFTGSAGVRFPDAPEFDLGTSDFEVSFWIRPVGSGIKYVFGQYDGSGSFTKWSIGIVLNNRTLQFQAYSGSSTCFNGTSSVDLVTDEWTFVSFTRIGTSFKAVQGNTPGGSTSVVASGTSAASINSSPGRLGVGRLGDYSAANVNAYIDELRFRVGVAEVFSTCPSSAFSH